MKLNTYRFFFSFPLASNFKRFLQFKHNFSFQSVSFFKIHSDSRRELNHTLSRPDCICDIHVFIMSLMLASVSREGWIKRLACTNRWCEHQRQFSTAGKLDMLLERLSMALQSVAYTIKLQQGSTLLLIEVLDSLFSYLLRSIQRNKT